MAYDNTNHQPAACPQCGREIEHYGSCSNNYYCPKCKIYPEPDEVFPQTDVTLQNDSKELLK